MHMKSTATVQNAKGSLAFYVCACVTELVCFIQDIQQIKYSSEPLSPAISSLYVCVFTTYLWLFLYFHISWLHPFIPVNPMQY